MVYHRRGRGPFFFSPPSPCCLVFHLFTELFRHPPLMKLFSLYTFLNRNEAHRLRPRRPSLPTPKEIGVSCRGAKIKNKKMKKRGEPKRWNGVCLVLLHSKRCLDGSLLLLLLLSYIPDRSQSHHTSSQCTTIGISIFWDFCFFLFSYFRNMCCCWRGWAD